MRWLLIIFSLRSHLLDSFAFCFLLSCCCTGLTLVLNVNELFEVTDSGIIFLLVDVWHFHWDAFMLLFYIVVKYKHIVINLRGRIAFVHIFSLLFADVLRAYCKPCLL